MAEAPHAELAAAGEAAHGSGGFAPFDAAYFGNHLFWLALSFGGLYLLLSRWVLPKIAAALEARRLAREQDLAAAARANETARSELAAYERSLTEARNEARRALEAARAELAEAHTRETAEAEQRFASRMEAVESRLAAGREAALKEAQAAGAEAAESIAAKLAPFPEAMDPRRVAAGGA